jgi:hypothetical protein
MSHTPTSYVFGIHHFCDHRCWRCALAPRCAVHARWAEAGKRRGWREPAGRVAGVIAASLEVTLEEAAILMTSVGAPGGAAASDTATRFEEIPQSAAPLDIPERSDREDAGARAHQHPVVARGAEYARLSWPVLKALGPVLARRKDRAALDAAERLEETFASVASKIFRAVSSSLEDYHDASDVQSDANGSAKVALLLIEESRQAWRELMQPGRAVGNGAPARLVRILDALETEVLTLFPHAFSFVRPGFDTGDANGPGDQIAQALLQAGRTIGQAQ